MTILSDRQKKIINFIEKWFSEYDYAPSVRDIQIGCEISSTSVVQYNLEKLKTMKKFTFLFLISKQNHLKN